MHSPSANRSKFGPNTPLRMRPSTPKASSTSTKPPSSRSSTSSQLLTLQTVIGTTTACPNGFACHRASRSFAFCAGSAAILAELDAELRISQQFFRARPSALGVHPTSSFYHPSGGSSSAPVTPEQRSRSLAAGRAAGQGIFPAASLGGEWGDGAVGSPRTHAAKDRVKAVVSLGISPDGRFLAVGETGYGPRVLIFSTAKTDPNDVPLSIMTEHSFAVKCLAFSPNSVWLASLGDVNDGFLFIWSINPKNGAAKLHSTSKCISVVHSMAWVGNVLITVGVRYIKVWRPEGVRPASPVKPKLSSTDWTPSSPSSQPKTLNGRNCILGSLNEATFTCISPISDRKAIICTENGAICLFDDTDEAQKLTYLKSAGFRVLSSAADEESDSLWLCGEAGKMEKFSISELIETIPSREPSPDSERPKSRPGSKAGPASAGDKIAMGIVGSSIVSIDSERVIQLSACNGENKEGDAIELLIPAHNDSVLGASKLVRPNAHDADFYTWSAGGAVSYWDLDGNFKAEGFVELEQVEAEGELPNELRVVRFSEDLKTAVSGDRYGVIRLFDASSWEFKQSLKAHGAEVTDVAIVQTDGFFTVATAGRDRTIQIFKQDGAKLELVQTLEDHVGSVNNLLFCEAGEKLLSSSVDRTVIVRERVLRQPDDPSSFAYAIVRTVTLKAAPVSMVLLPEDPSKLVVSSTDKQVQSIDFASGQIEQSFRASDADSSEAVVMASIAVSKLAPNGSRCVIGVASTDKSVRAYDFNRELLLACEFGHTEGVTGALLIEREGTDEPKRTVVSTGMDGVIMIWDLSPQLPSSSNESADPQTPSKEPTAFQQPLRKIISRSQLAEAQKLENSPHAGTSEPHSPTKTSRPLQKSSLASAFTHSSPTPAHRTPISHARKTSRDYKDKEKEKDDPPSPTSPRASSTRTTTTTHAHPLRHTPSLGDARARQRISHTPKEKTTTTTGSARKASGPAHTASSGAGGFGSLSASTESVCHTLKLYRKKLAAAEQGVDELGLLRRELEMTMKLIESKTSGSGNGPVATGAGVADGDAEDVSRSTKQPDAAASAESSHGDEDGTGHKEVEDGDDEDDGETSSAQASPRTVSRSLHVGEEDHEHERGIWGEM